MNAPAIHAIHTLARPEVPPLPLVLGEATHTVGLWSGRDKATCRPSIAKHEYESTPDELASWLVALAQRCQTRANAVVIGAAGIQSTES